jgi:hypothetical protein
VHPDIEIVPERTIAKLAEKAWGTLVDKARAALQIVEVAPTFDIDVLNARPENLLAQLLDLMIRKSHSLREGVPDPNEDNVMAEVKAMMTLAMTAAGLEVQQKNYQSPSGGGVNHAPYGHAPYDNTKGKQRGEKKKPPQWDYSTIAPKHHKPNWDKDKDSWGDKKDWGKDQRKW